MNKNDARPARPRSARPMRVAAGDTRTQTRDSQSARTRFERYLALARSKALIGDRIEAENYYQHAEHYLRSMSEGVK